MLPPGLCGSGVLTAVSELVRTGLIDETGLLADPWFSEGFLLAKRPDGTAIRLYQEDIRAVQLAKAAICAGAETLSLSQGIPVKDIDTVLVAGAFGGALPFSDMEPLGLLPPVLLKKCHSVGNAALKGTIRILRAVLEGPDAERSVLSQLDDLIRRASELPLAGRQDFEALYLARMGFEGLFS